MECFTEATGIGLICLDKTLAIPICNTARWSTCELASLDFKEVISHLDQITLVLPTRYPDACHVTLTTRQGFIYLIRALRINWSGFPRTWFLVSEPMITESVPAPANYPVQAPIVSRHRIDQLGITLDHLCRTFSATQSADCPSDSVWLSSDSPLPS